MSEVKLTKNGLREQQHSLTQLLKYLPTLQLKKAMLQLEVNEAKVELIVRKEEKKDLLEKIYHFSSIFSDMTKLDITDYVKVKRVVSHKENIAGVEFEVFEKVIFDSIDYFFYDQPVWLESVLSFLYTLIERKEEIILIQRKKEALEKELRAVSIRVNLFEKVLIPKAVTQIKKIKIFLGDQGLFAVSQAKIAKTKIIKRKQLTR